MQNENQIKNDQKSINTPIQNMLASTQEDSKTGPLIGSIIIILIVVLGGLYFWGSLLANNKLRINSLREQANTLEIEETAKQSTSTDVKSIEADLKITNIDNLDSEIDNIEIEF